MQWPLTVPPDLDEQAKQLSAVRRIHIEDMNLLADYRFYFPRATDIVIDCPNLAVLPSLGLALERIVPLQNVISLELTRTGMSWEVLLETLLSLPSLGTLSVSCFAASPAVLNNLRESANFQLVASRNRIHKFTIEDLAREGDALFICTLFPRLEYFVAKSSGEFLEAVISNLFSNNSDFARHLHTILVAVRCPKYLKKIASLIRKGRLAVGFSYRIMKDELGLWR